MLLEGEDLTVEDGQVMVRTIAGLEPVSVLWRRIDAAYRRSAGAERDTRGSARPAWSRRIRRGQLAMVNALGSGILETRALLAFLPRLAQALLGEPLKLPNIATWWCGQRDASARMCAPMLDRMMIGPALSTRLLFETEDDTVLGAALRGAERGDLEPAGGAKGAMLVGQEAVTLSTTPVYVDGKLRRGR